MIKYLEKNNYEITEITGTSMGALVAAIYTAEKTKNPSDEKIYKRLTEIAHEVEYLRMVDYTIKDGWLKGEKSYNTICKYVGDITFTEAIIPIKIAAHNLQT